MMGIRTVMLIVLTRVMVLVVMLVVILAAVVLVTDVDGAGACAGNNDADGGDCGDGL